MNPTAADDILKKCKRIFQVATGHTLD